MPEYVAGLQFHTVFLIHADNVDYDEVQGSQGASRRYVSRIYLGASRASRELMLASSLARGGATTAVRGAVQRKSLVQISKTGF